MLRPKHFMLLMLVLAALITAAILMQALESIKAPNQSNSIVMQESEEWLVGGGSAPMIMRGEKVCVEGMTESLEPLAFSNGARLQHYYQPGIWIYLLWAGDNCWSFPPELKDDYPNWRENNKWKIDFILPEGWAPPNGWEKGTTSSFP